MAVATDPFDKFVRKWGGVPAPQGSPTSTLMELDARRVAVGKSPLTEDQTSSAIQAATIRGPVTPQPEDKNPLAIWSNITSDVTNLLRGLPQLPMAIANTGKEAITQGPLTIPEGGNIADAPVTRLLPGAFIASAVLPGGVPAGELATSPVTTFLDALPFVSKALNTGSLSRIRQLESAPGKVATPTNLYRDASASTAADLMEGLQQARFGDLSTADRLAIQTQIARGQGRRVIPDLMANRVLQDPVTGISELQPRRWQTKMLETPALKPLFNLAPRTRTFHSQLKRVESMMGLEARATPEFIEGVDFSRRLEAAFGTEKALNEVAPMIRTALEDPGSFNKSFRSPLEARTALPDEVKPFFDEYYEKLLPSYTDRLLTKGDGFEEPKIGVYRRTNDIYNIEELRRLETADQKLSARQRDLTAAYDAFRSNATRRLIADIGAEPFDLVMNGRGDEALAMLRERKISGPKKKVSAVEQLRRLDDQIEQLSNADVESLRRLGRPSVRLNYGDLGPYFTGKEWGRLATSHKDAVRQARVRLNLHSSVRPATESATGSRLLWERYRVNFDEAQRMADKYGPLQWERYKEMFRRSRLPETSDLDKGILRRSLREQLGSDYRLLHYVLPDDPNWIDYGTDPLWRQNMAKLMTDNERARLYSEVRQSLADMADDTTGAGPLRPAYVPRMASEAIGQIDNTTIRASYLNPEYAKKRSFDYAPMHPDLGMSLSYNVLRDHMARRGIPQMIEAIRNSPYAMTEAQLDTMLQSEARTLIAAGREGIDLQAYINEAKRGENPRFVAFQPESLFPNVSPTAANAQQVWLPVEFDNVVNASVRTAMDTNAFSRLVDPVTGLFRSSVLLYSPRWHWYNIMSNGFLTSVVNPKALARIPEEMRTMGNFEGLRRMMKEGDITNAGLEMSLRGQGENSAAMLRVGFPGLLGATENITAAIRKSDQLDHLRIGLGRARTAHRLWNEIQKAHHKVGGASLGLNAFFDDVARRANFHAFYETELARLIDDAQQWRGTKDLPDSVLENIEQSAAERALSRTQDWLMDWSQMLPVERSLLRTIFPFYSFTAHILRAALKFPFDHPLRVATINAFTRAEEEDWMSGYPPVFRGLLGLPPDDDDNNFVGINVNSWNPFRDVGSILTMAGILSSVNPVIGAVFESVGVDTMRGGPEYAPNFIYDPENLGGTRFDSGNPIVNLGKNLVPQAGLIAQFLGVDSAFREVQVRDPAAAHRMMLSGLGMPVVFRDINLNEAFARDELKRFNDLQQSISSLDAGNVGRYSEAAGQAVAQTAEYRQLRDKRAGELAQLIVERKGGPPYNPLSAFVTV